MNELVFSQDKRAEQSDELALQKIQSALTAASETQVLRCMYEKINETADLNPMAIWVNEILKAFYVFEDVDKATKETMAALDEIKYCMTPKEAEAFLELVTMASGWILLFYVAPNHKSHKYTDDKCVYILQMNNGTIKIGITTDFEKRLNTIKHNSGLEVIKSCRTDYLADAHKIESACHKHFRAYRLKGEFFKIEYAEACAELEKYAPIVHDAVVRG